MEEKKLVELFDGLSKKIIEAQGKSSEEFLKTIIETNSILKQIKDANPVPPDMKEKLRMENPNYRFACYLSAIKTHDEAMLKKFEAEEKAVTTAMNETTTTAGGYLVPTLTEASIRELATTIGQALQVFNVMPFAKGNVYNMPKLSSGATAYVVGEQSANTASAVALDVDTLTPYKFGVEIPLSMELLLDSTPEIGQFIIKAMAKAEMYLLDTKCFQNAATTWAGVFYASNTFGNTETLEGSNPKGLTYDNLVNCANGVDYASNINPTWYFSRGILSVIQTIKDKNDRPIFDFTSKTLLGYPYKVIEQAPTSADSASKPIIIFGNLNNSILGDVQGRRVTIDETGNATINGSNVDLRSYDLAKITSYKRYSFAVGLTNAYSIIKTHA